jgi:hypothetical protein
MELASGWADGARLGIQAVPTTMAMTKSDALAPVETGVISTVNVAPPEISTDMLAAPRAR